MRVSKAYILTDTSLLDRYKQKTFSIVSVTHRIRTFSHTTFGHIPFGHTTFGHNVVTTI